MISFLVFLPSSLAAIAKSTGLHTLWRGVVDTCTAVIKGGSSEWFSFFYHILYLKKIIIVDLQCSFNFHCTVNLPSHMYNIYILYIHTFFFILSFIMSQPKKQYTLTVLYSKTHYSFVLNVIVCIYQPSPSLPSPPNKHKSAFNVHDLFLFCR